MFSVACVVYRVRQLFVCFEWLHPRDFLLIFPFMFIYFCLLVLSSARHIHPKKRAFSFSVFSHSQCIINTGRYWLFCLSVISFYSLLCSRFLGFVFEHVVYIECTWLASMELQLTKYFSLIKMSLIYESYPTETFLDRVE